MLKSNTQVYSVKGYILIQALVTSNTSEPGKQGVSTNQFEMNAFIMEMMEMEIVNYFYKIRSKKWIAQDFDGVLCLIKKRKVPDWDN